MSLWSVDCARTCRAALGVAGSSSAHWACRRRLRATLAGPELELGQRPAMKPVTLTTGRQQQLRRLTATNERGGHRAD